MEKLIFATGNRAAVEQLRFVASFFHLNVDIVSARDTYGTRAAYQKKEATPLDIALHGALHVSRQIHEAVITEFTALYVHALDNQPGILSESFLKRYNQQKLLDQMVGMKDRSAHITSALAYATPGGLTRTFTTTIEGHIADAEHGGNFPAWVSPSFNDPRGCGFNSIFIPDGQSGVTMAQINPADAIPWGYRERNFIDVLTWLLKVNEHDAHEYDVH